MFEASRSGPNRCPAHRRAARASRQPTDPRYGSQQWRDYSMRFRAANPFCSRCGMLTEVVGHVQSVNAAPHLFFDESNHTPLCHSCNRSQTIEDARR